MHFGVGVTLSLANTDLHVDATEAIVKGSLSGTLTPDVYERTAGT